MAAAEYYNDAAQAGNYLRLMLGLLGKHKIPPNLINISLCYEYVSETNNALQKAMDKVFEDNNYSEEKAISLYKYYIWDDEKRTHEKLSIVLNKHFAEVLKNLHNTTSKNTDSSNFLEKKVTELQSVSSKNKVEEIVQSIISESKNVVSINQSFETELIKQQSELEELKLELKETKKLAETDPLTKLNNRRTLEKAMEKHTTQSAAKNEPLSLLIIDIDHFKLVNDKYGHIIGDKVICFVAKTLVDNVKRKDVSARIGGEEFAILLPNTKLNNALVLAEGLRKIIAKSRLRIANSQEKIDAVTVSIGVTLYKPTESIEAFIERADRALYSSKNTGRNKVTSSKI